MKNLQRLMEEFSILGMEPSPIDSETGMEFDVDDDSSEEEYELDAEGNPVLDKDGNPIKKLPAPEDNGQNCTCDGVQVGQMGQTGPMDTSLEPPQGDEDPEFDFNI